jgi:hypothetical protein
MSTARYAELHAPRIASLRHGDLQTYGRGVRLQKEKLVHGMVERGYTPEFAERTFAQLEGFGSYDSRKATWLLLRSSPMPPLGSNAITRMSSARLS